VVDEGEAGLVHVAQIGLLPISPVAAADCHSEFVPKPNPPTLPTSARSRLQYSGMSRDDGKGSQDLRQATGSVVMKQGTDTFRHKQGSDSGLERRTLGWMNQ
jgi:hypothetical protein